MSALQRITESTEKTGPRAYRRGLRQLTGPIGGLLPGLLWLAGTAGCGSALPEELVKLTEQGKSTTTESHTDFQTFEYTRTPGLGFYTDAGAVSGAIITREPSGGYRLETRVWEGTDGADSRITWAGLLGDWESTGGGADDEWNSDWSWQNPTEQDLPPRELTAGEVQRMLSVFAAVPVEYEYIDALIDYYVLEDARWDNRSLSANPTYGYSETIAYPKLDEIVQLLEDFRSASEP